MAPESKMARHGAEDLFLVDEMGILNHKYRDEKYARRLLIAGLVKLLILGRRRRTCRVFVQIFQKILSAVSILSEYSVGCSDSVRVFR